MSPSIIPIKNFFPKNVTAFYTTRTGGFSKHSYAHFNLADNIGDNPNFVARNRKFLIHYIKTKVVWLRQVHSNKVFDMDTIVEQDFLDTKPDLPVADSSITSKVCQCSVVVTAD